MKRFVDALGCNRNVRSDIASAVSILASSFGEALSGIILTGSLARGCFRQPTSDVDLLVVLKNHHGAGASASSVAEGLSELPTAFDLTVMTSAQLATDEWPTPITCLIKPPGRVITKPEGSRDVLLHRQDAYEAGILIWENRLVEIRPVPSHLVARCVEYLYPYIRHRFKNPALMFCRVLYWIEYGSLCSKSEAAAAASRLLPPHFQPLVCSDLASYTGEHIEHSDPNQLAELERYTEEIIRSATPD